MRNISYDDYLKIISNYTGRPNTLNFWLQKNYSDLYNDIVNNAKFWNSKKIPSFIHKVIWYFCDIHEYQICPVCGKINDKILPDSNPDKIQDYLNDHSLFGLCSRSCLYKSDYYQNKMKQFYLSKYGVDNPNKLQSIKDKVKTTLLEHYGPDGLQSESIREKKKKTCIERYGVEYSAQSKKIKDKIKETFNKKYNGHPLKDAKIQAKFKETCREHFGTDHYMKNDLIKEKVKNTTRKHFGVNSPMQCDSIKQKVKSTMLERYGSDNASKVEHFKEKKIKTSQRNYGTDYSFQAEPVKEKIRQTLQLRYGVDNPSQNPDSHTKQIESITKAKRQHSYDFINKHSTVEILTPLEEYLKMDFKTQPLKWKCKTCGNIFETRRDNNEMGTGRCYTCFPYVPSKYELEIQNYLRNIGCNDIIIRDRTILYPKELDIYIPSKKLAIEFNGLYWHSTQYCPGSYRHLIKTQNCLEKNIRLVQIFEDEYVFKNNIVLDRLSNILGNYKTTIYARQCKVDQVSFNESKEFLNQNHIQGWVNSKFNYGMYYNNELVALMTFGEYRIALGRKPVNGEYELLRFCCKLGYHIPGAASRLLKHFENDIKPIKLISYADRRWSQGKLYEILNFKFVKFTEPNYSYVIGDHRENRFKWRKSELKYLLEYFDPNLSEEENMAKNNYFRIYDCGNYLFEKVY